MSVEATSTIGSIVRRVAVAIVCVIVAACASPPPPSPPTPPSTPVGPTQTEIRRAALRAMNFEPRDDGWHLSLPAPLVFSFDSDAVAATARDNLLRVGRELTELGIDRALVHGHTDNVGTAEYNMALSKRRADAVARVLAEGGFPADRIDARGLGATVPTADNASAEGRAQNRRVVIIVQAI